MDQADICYGKWWIRTGTDSGAGGNLVDWVGLGKAGNDETFKTGQWSGSEIQNGRSGESSYRQGSCDATEDAAWDRVRIHYDAGFWNDKWQVVDISLKVARSPGSQDFIKCYRWSGSYWVGDGYRELTWNSSTC
ncbi:hypothetical protein SAMN05216188_13075 [Lentzea xinjiangensis]|uniref:Uncharacterized protein n=2 Tax=Lentzea xinjiangensis TaxID=402600 RepID=A0A1H9W4B7_9PSEU|nr:hypothetical protein SAMN05216188_13075 [Lentzea xinjiangensis]